MRDQRTKLALKLACLFVFPLELQLVSQSLLRTMELNHFWMNVLIFLLLCLSEIFSNPQNSQKTKIQNKKIFCENSMLFNIKSLGSIDWLPVNSNKIGPLKFSKIANEIQIKYIFCGFDIHLLDVRKQ